MAFFLIPTDQCEAFQKQLHDEYQIEAPTVRWNNRTLLRISVIAYNNAQELDGLVEVIAACLKA